MTLLNYNSYEDYLDHFININDVRYLRNWSLSRQFIQNACGKSCMGRLLSRSEYAEQRKKLEIMLNPRGISESTLFGEDYEGNDSVLKEFADREYQLLNKQISTIIFLVMRSKQGLEVSGFIDLEESLRESHYKHSEHYVNWPAIFEGKDKLIPQPFHLSFFDWYKNKVKCNNSANFKVVSGRAHSLLMMHRGDHKIICVNAGCTCNWSKNAKRSVYSSSIYGQCLFFDHIIRRIN
ncbi:cilia- and flagella-associated protein 299 [Drosophila novamexicana]|uniref:cilia- and flagella-associated protein 299 n=1 Tax=Drosophila novamexicana TaxID=47314 RepID=UPI0011E5B3B8|nr:cilia- and flagella-associated protein 299 [Drosophila novamexicana]